MTSINTITLEVADPAAAARFYRTAFGLESPLALRAGQEPTTGFRGYTLSLIMSQPADVKALFETAVEAGATALKPVTKSMWGWGGVVRAPDGAIWKVATSAKKDTAAASREYQDLVLLLGVADVVASKRFYTDHGLTVAKSFGRMYVEFEAPEGAIKLGLYRRRALAKDAGVAADGGGSHRIAIGGAASFTDPDGFAWETTSMAALS